MPQPINVNNTIQNTLNWLYAFIVGRPMTGVGGTVGEPALTLANMAMQTILAAPFAWSWNRQLVQPFTCQIGVSDYIVSAPNFGWLEKATVYLSGGNPPTFELEASGLLAQDGKNMRPTKIAPVYDDNQGNITFRLFANPDQAYTVTIIYQQKPPRITSLLTYWTPIPDKYAFLYERFMLAHMRGMYDIPGYLQDLNLFIRQLVGASEGLTEIQKAIFLEESIKILVTQQNAMSAANQGRQSRG